MARIRCPNCRNFVSVPMWRELVQCPTCSWGMAIRWAKPFFNLFFLLTLLPVIICGYDLLSHPVTLVGDLLPLPFSALLALVVYELLMMFFGAKSVYWPKASTSETVPGGAGAPPAQPEAKNNQPPALVALLLVFIAAYVAWVYFYLTAIRPLVNSWAFQYVSAYPASLHLLPLVGLPLVLIAGTVKLYQLFAGPAQGPNESNRPAVRQAPRL